MTNFLIKHTFFLFRHSFFFLTSFIFSLQGGSCVIPGRDDAENFRKVLAAMEIMDFTREEQDTVKKILASVLHIGNVYFKNVQVLF